MFSYQLGMSQIVTTNILPLDRLVPNHNIDESDPRAAVSRVLLLLLLPDVNQS